MKKIHYIVLSIVSLIILLGVIYSLSQKESDSQENLADLQKIVSTKDITAQEEIVRLSPEKQKQLNQITGIYTKEEETHNATIVDILRKYKSNFTENDQTLILSLVEQSSSSDELKVKIKETLNINFLQSDIRKIFESKEKLIEEKEIELARLELFSENNKKDLNVNIQSLIELSIRETMRQNTILSTQDITEVSKQVTLKIFKENILEYTSSKEQETLLQETLSLFLKPFTVLSLSEKQTLIIHIIKDISELDILLLPKETPEKTPEHDSVSLLFPTPIFESFQKLGFLLLPKAHASATPPFTPSERAILILKTQVFIERILQESIETEIRYNNKSLTQLEYQNIIEQNLIELEELVILKDSLENDPSAISLDDIQRFNLGSYVDDSIAIQNLPVLAYIQEKTGHIIIYNLNGSTKLGEENISLYSGYGIETLADSTVTLVFSDESILRLDPLSRVNISTPSTSNISVAVEKGTIWTRVLRPLLSGDIFTIDSDGISLGVRGTSISFSKDTTDTTIHIVDSYTSDGSPSVTLTETNSGAQTPIPKGQKISINNTTKIVTKSNETRTSLLSQKPQIGDFIREDLNYLSLLLSDRKRGFYNTPIIAKNDSDAFLQKIAGELEVSLPSGGETGYIIKNTELAGELVNTGSIYHLIQKDTLITDIRNNPIGDTAAKIQAVKDLDMQNLEDQLGNKRALENRFEYQISQDITSQNTFTVTQLKDIFLGFPIEDAQDDARLLAEAKRSLSINAGSSIVTGDIFLPTSLSGVTFTWESQNPIVISETGRVTPQDHDKSVILTATLTLGNLSATKDFGLTVVPREPSDQDRLEAAAAVLDTYITTQILFGDSILYHDADGNIQDPDFSENEGITPLFTWTGALVNIDGDTRRPRYSESPDNEFMTTLVRVTLTHPTAYPSISLAPREYTIGVRRKDPTPEEELLRNISDSFWSSYITSQGSDIERIGDSFFIQAKNLFFPKNDTGITISYSVTQNSTYYSMSEQTTQYKGKKQAYCDIDKPIKIKAVFSFPGLPNIQKTQSFIVPKRGQTIGGDCYELVASAEYNTPGDINLRNIETGGNIPKQQRYVTGVNCSGSNTGNCGWANKQKIATMYNYDVSQISSSFNKENSWFTYDGESGIVVDNVDEDDYLSYDISSLNLGSDWAIEMSVRGEDLKRNQQYYLFTSPLASGGNFGIYNAIGTNNSLRFIYSGASPNEIITRDTMAGIEIPNQYQKVIFTPAKHYIEGFDAIQNNSTGALLANTIKIGGNSLDELQWNGIINYFKIYKISN